MDDNLSICDSFETLKERITKCRDCCSGNFLSYHCFLCPIHKYKPTQLGKVQKHLLSHWKTRVQGQNGQYAVACHLAHETSESCRHYHCPSCGKIYKSRRSNLVRHIQTCQRNVMLADGTVEEQHSPHRQRDFEEQHDSEEQHISEEQHYSEEQHDFEERHVSEEQHDSEEHDQITPNRTLEEEQTFLIDHDYGESAKSKKRNANQNGVRCPVCKKVFTAKWIRHHIQLHTKKDNDINQNRHHFTVVIDPKQGIFTSSINLTGPRWPIHIQKTTCGSEQSSFCENSTCNARKETAVRGTNRSYECPHIKSIPYATPGIEVFLQTRSLDELLESNIITESRYNEAISLCQSATEKGSPFVVRVPHDNHTSDRYIYLSIYTNCVRYWSLVGRVIATYDTTANKITCKCSVGRRYCEHKVIVKWYLSQEMPALYSCIEREPETDDEDMFDTNVPEREKRPDRDGDVMDVMVEYLKSKKSIPSNSNCETTFQYNTAASTHTRGRDLVPSETHCNECGCPLHSISVAQTKIVTMTQIDTDTKLWQKKCARCQRIFRYQEWKDGVHNFNNKLLLGLDVCRYIRSGLQNHVAIGRSISVLEDFLGVKLNIHEMERAYLHYEALCDHSYEFNCVLCGYHPTILIWDTFRKASFRYADLKIPDGTNTDRVNIKQFWTAVEDSLLQEGFDNAGKSLAPLVVPAYDNWGPWIGEYSRIGDEVFNTEHRKCSPSNDDDDIEPMPEELLLHLLNDEKVTNIRRICRSLGISPKGSTMDMILRMREKSISRGTFDKAYEKVFGCSGGWAVGCCVHGIVYAIKCLLRSESPRDYIDLERSLKHRPNVSICDIAHLLAAHGNKTEPDMFSPYEGRLGPATEENLLLTDTGSVTFTAPFLNSIESQPSGHSDQNYNPVAQSDIHLALFDWFHEGNCKTRTENLRKSSLLKEVAGLVDTQAVEQLFNSSKRDIYFFK